MILVGSTDSIKYPPAMSVVKRGNNVTYEGVGMDLMMVFVEYFKTE